MNYLHRAWAEIDLDALVHNFKLVRSMTDAKIFSVVKANAYGHAVPLIAQKLDRAGTDYFAVSNIDEARELRDLGIKKPILILGYTPPFLAKELFTGDIIQTVYSEEYAEKLNEFAKTEGVKLKVHLKLDTGMARIGFDCRTDELSGLSAAKKALCLENLVFTGVFTHFPVADSHTPADKEFTDQQFSRFLKAVELLETDDFKFEIKHCCNSAATLLYGDKHLDAVRPGIILYGLTPSVDIELKLPFKPVMTFKATVSMVKELDAEQTVSYGRTFSSDHPIRLATVTAGYADGFPRLLSSKGEVLIKGHRASIVGRICMDQFCCDVSHIEGVEEGDQVILFGEGLPVEEMARNAETINYEIVCGLSKRVPRIYLNEE